MMTSEAKKEAIRKYKERKTARGIFVVECSATGRKWVGSSRNLDATRNSLWFALRMGNHHDRSLQEHWQAVGEPAFGYRIIETLDEDASALNVPDLLKEKAALWTAQLGAETLRPW
jgi:hypothetical protein